MISHKDVGSGPFKMVPPSPIEEGGQCDRKRTVRFEGHPGSARISAEEIEKQKP